MAPYDSRRSFRRIAPPCHIRNPRYCLALPAEVHRNGYKVFPDFRKMIFTRQGYAHIVTFFVTILQTLVTLVKFNRLLRVYVIDFYFRSKVLVTFEYINNTANALQILILTC